MQSRRYRSHSRRHERHRHHRDSAGEGMGCARFCDRGIGSEGARLRGTWAPFAASITRPRILSRSSARRPRVTASTSRSIWLRAATCSGIWISRRSRAASSPFRCWAARAPKSIVGVIMIKRLTLTGSTLRSRTVAQKAAVADGVRQNVWPLDRVRQSAAGHFQDISAGRGERSASAHGVFQSHRQDRAHGVTLAEGRPRQGLRIVRARSPGWRPSLGRFPRKIAARAAFCRRQSSV